MKAVIVKAAELREYLKEMPKDHWEEAGDTDLPLEINWGVIEELEKKGHHLSLALLHNQKLVGYAGFTVTPHLHSKHAVSGDCHAIYVRPDSRSYAGAIELISTAEKFLKAAGVNRITISHDNEALDSILKRRKYNYKERTHGKVLCPIAQTI